MALTDLNLLYDSFLKSLKGSAWKEEPQRFEIDVLSEIVRLKQEIESRTYVTSQGTEFTLNERGKIRHIHGARMRDRVVRHALCDGELADALRPYLIYNNGASQKGKGLTFARKMFARDLHNFWLKYRDNDGYIGFVDFSKFYDNIRHDLIRTTVGPKLSEEGRWLLDEILRTFEIDVSYMTAEEYAGCMEQKFNSVQYYETIQPWQKTGERFMPKSVDIGDQVSQDIGIFFPTPVDNYVKIVRGVKWYGRYMDDLYIISRDREELQSVIDGIMIIARAMGMFINEQKTHIARLGDIYRYLQIKYTLTPEGRVVKRISPKAVTRERKRLRAYKGLMERGRLTYEDVESACRSWMGDYARLMSRKQIEHMKNLYKALFGKELTWKQPSNSKTAQKSSRKSTGTAISQKASPHSQKI